MPSDRISALQYLKRELKFSVGEWGKLTEEDKETLKRWAVEEMDVLGVPHI